MMDFHVRSFEFGVREIKGWSCHNAACTYPVKTFVMPFAFAGRSFQLQSSVPCLDRETRESKGYADMLRTLRSQIFPNV